MLRVHKCIFVSNVKLVVVNIVQEHIDTAKVIGGEVDLLTIETLTNILFAKDLRCFQKKRTRAAGGVVDFVYFSLSYNSNAGQQFGNFLRGEEFAAALSCVGCVHAHQVFVSITKSINGVVFVVAQLHVRNALN